MRKGSKQGSSSRLFFLRIEEDPTLTNEPLAMPSRFASYLSRVKLLTLFTIIMLSAMLILTFSQMSKAQMINPHIFNLAVSNVNHDYNKPDSSSDSAYLVIKTDTTISATLSVSYDNASDTDPNCAGLNLRSASSTVNLAGDDGYLRHEILLDQLPASCVINYWVKDPGNDDQVIAESSFRTPQREGEPFSFGVVSDLHSGDGVSGDVTKVGTPHWRDTLNRMKEENLDMAISGGDAIHVRGWWDGPIHWGDGYYESLAEIENKYNALFSGSATVPGGTMQLTASVPLYTATGNHEEISYSTAKAAYEQEFALPVNNGTEASTNGEEYYSFDRGDTHFISLSTEIPSANGGSQKDSGCCLILGAQKNWLINDLVESQGKKWTVVFLHRPMFAGIAPNTDSHYGQESLSWGNCSAGYSTDYPDPNDCFDTALANRDEIHNLFIDYGVDVVFEGHAHHYNRHVEDGITYVLTGAGGGMDDYTPQWTYPGDVYEININEHMKIDETPDNLVIKSIETLTGNTIDSFIPVNRAIIGTWDPVTSTCTLASDVVAAQGISIDGNNVTLDGNGHKLIGNQNYSALLTGVVADTKSNVTVKNLAVEGYWMGIWFKHGSSNQIVNSAVAANTMEPMPRQIWEPAIRSATLPMAATIGATGLRQTQTVTA
ncbi:MAG: metallophosphoesterase [Actinobacteria bacterium]|nr:metallophosphoesterase [Actinomycetota bacterium]